MFYGRIYLSEEEFWENILIKEYQILRKKYNSENLLSITDKLLN